MTRPRPRATRLAAIILLGLACAACGGGKKAFAPNTRSSDAPAQHTLSQLQSRINAGDVEGICNLYASPSKRCESVWKLRIAGLHRPVRLTMRRLVLGCAGDARLEYELHSATGTVSRSLSLVDTGGSSPEYTLLIDVPMNGRASSLAVPQYGTCADPDWGNGGIGAKATDPASTGAQANGS